MAPKFNISKNYQEFNIIPEYKVKIFLILMSKKLHTEK